MNMDDLHGDQFQQTVLTAAETMNYGPYVGERLQKAIALVLAGGVTLEDGYATVKSGTHTYAIQDEEGCTCADSQNRTRYCKHFIAVELFKRAVSGHVFTTNGTHAAVMTNPPRSAVWDVHEAPASCCLKFQTSGVECLYTMRDIDDDLLYARVRRILPKIMERMIHDEDKAASPDASDYCPVHDVQMRQYTKGDQSWHSHRLPDGSWCRGK